MRGLRTTLLAVGFAFSIAACDSGGTGSVQAPVDEHVHRNALIELDWGAVANSSVCNGFEPGRPVPVANEDEFGFCMNNCVTPPSGEPGCQQTCCEEVTGCEQCFVQ
jgi:hypothetical protein